MKYPISRILFLSIFLFSSSFAAVPSNNTSFITFSDIHFNPFISCTKTPCALIQKLNQSPSSQWMSLLNKYDKSTQQYWHDTNHALLLSSLTKAKEVAKTQHAAFVIVLGDFLAHRYKRRYKKFSGDKSARAYTFFVRKTFEFLSAQLKEAFPDIDVYAVVGNNDSYQDNYVSDPKGRFFKEMAEVWASLIINADHQAAMQKSFIQGGYYAVDLSQAMRLIVLNTNFFSYKARGNSINEAALEELNWLHRQLVEARQHHQKILIALHIPESVVVSVLGVPLFTLMELWKRPYQQRFDAELQLFAGQISGILAGHLHRNWQQSLNVKEAVASIPLSGTLSVSPILGNDPGFKLYDYSNSTYQLERAVTYYQPLMDGKWRTKASIFH